MGNLAIPDNESLSLPRPHGTTRKMPGERRATSPARQKTKISGAYKCHGQPTAQQQRSLGAYCRNAKLANLRTNEPYWPWLGRNHRLGRLRPDFENSAKGIQLPSGTLMG